MEVEHGGGGAKASEAKSGVGLPCSQPAAGVLECALWDYVCCFHGISLYRDQPLAGVIVSINSALRDTTDELGNYQIRIPTAQQKKEQEVLFSKPGFKFMTKKAYPQTNEPMNVVMVK